MKTEPDVAGSMALLYLILVEQADLNHAERIGDLTEAVRVAEELIAAFPHVDEVRDEARFYAAWAHDDLFVLTGEKSHLDREIELLRAGVRAGRTDMVEPLVGAYAARHRLGEAGDTTDIDTAIELQRELLAATGAQEERTQLGLLVAERCRASAPEDPDELRHLDEAIALLDEAIDLVPQDDPDHPAVVAALGHLHVMSHLAPRAAPGATSTRDLDRGIALLRRVADADDHSADRLAFALELRFAEQKRAEDRDAAIDILERLGSRNPGYVDVSAEDLADLYLSRLEDTGDDTAFERAVTCLEHAIRLGQPGSEHLHVSLVEAYLRRWGRVPVRELDRLRPLCAEMSGRADADPFWTVLSLGIGAETANGSPQEIGSCVHRLAEAAASPRFEGLTRVTLLAMAAVLIARSHGCAPPRDWSPFREVAVGSGPTHDLLTWLRLHRSAVPADSPGAGLFAAGLALVSGHAATEFEERVADLEDALALLPSGHPLVPLLTYALGLAYKNGADSSCPDRIRNGIESLTAAVAGLHPDDKLRLECVGMLGSAFAMAYTSQVIDHTHIERADELISAALSSPHLEIDLRAALLATLGIVRGVSWVLDPDSCPMGSMVALHEQALALLPDDHPIAPPIRVTLANGMLARSVMTRNLDDVAQAEDQIRKAATLVEATGDTDMVSEEDIKTAANLATLLRLTIDDNVRADDMTQLDDLIAAMETKQDQDFSDVGVLTWARMIRARARGDAVEAVRQFENIGDQAFEIPEHVPFRHTLLSIKSVQIGADAVLRGDIVKLRSTVDEILRRASLPGVVAEERARLLYMAGNLWTIAHTKTRDTTFLDNAIEHLEPAYEIATGTVEPFAMMSAEQLTDAYWHRGKPGDAESSIRWGFVALREHARQVLLHEHLAHGTTKANTVVEHAHALTHRCAAVGRPEDAVAAIESGRALAMHAATSGDLVAAILRELGHDDLALEWTHHLRADQATSNDLRYRVLGALSGTDAEERLLSPPTPATVAPALRETGTDALVYLVPAAGDEPGRALMVDAAGGLRVLPLPQLSTSAGSPVDRYLTAHRLATTTYDTEQAAAVDRWRAELGELLWWAWPAVVDPVLRELESLVPDRTPRLVLVPCGPLGVVPWHAARAEGGGRTRFAIERAVFSYAASARQLCDVAARPARAVGEDVAVVANPGRDLFGGTPETRYLHRFLYPGAHFYGLVPSDITEAGEGSAEDVLALLPRRTSDGVSLLHLACHAWTGPTPADSYLRLADGATLTVADIVRHTRGRPKNAPGGLVLLSACGSDLADRDHDEAMTVASAMLACGAASVVGTRWQVDDLSSSLLMCLFHRYVTVDGMSPAEALRAAQLWALDRDSELPEDIASVFGPVTEIRLTTWAAFSHQGR